MMASLEYLGLVVAVALMIGALLVTAERRLSHRPPVRPIPVLVRPLAEPRPVVVRPRPPRVARRPAPPPRGPVVELPSWW